jgi:hypothetical protein
MNQILLSTAYFPPIEYFYFLSQADELLIEIHETYTKQSYRNRCNIYTPNGLLSLTIPIRKINGNHTKTKDIEITDHTNWRIQHWRSLQTAYNTSAFFIYYKDELWKEMQFDSNNLVEYNSNLLTFLMNEIGIKAGVKFTKEYKNSDRSKDLRTLINPKNKIPTVNTTQYYQVYAERHGFIPNLSILDLLFNEGPNTLNYLQSLNIS